MSEEQEQKFQRSGVRRPLVNFVWYQLLGEDIDESLAGIARSCDLSSSGAGIVTPRPLPTGALIFLEIATRKGNLSAVGRIIRCSPVPFCEMSLFRPTWELKGNAYAGGSAMPS